MYKNKQYNEDEGNVIISFCYHCHGVQQASLFFVVVDMMLDAFLLMIASAVIFMN